MYERFTDRARKVIQLANQEAQRFNHEYIGTEDLLLGLIKEGVGVAANVLKNLDLSVQRIRQEIEKTVQSAPDLVVTTGKLPPTPRMKKVIEYSIDEARNLNHNYVGTEHLLLGLLREEEGVAAQVLINLGLKLEDVRKETLRLLGPQILASANTGETKSVAERAGKKAGELAASVISLWRSQNKAGQEKPVPVLDPWAEMYSHRLTEHRLQELRKLHFLYEHLTLEKEAAVAEQDFDKAARLRDQANELKKIAQILVSQEEFDQDAKEYELLLPTNHDDGTPVAPEVFEFIEKQFRERFSTFIRSSRQVLGTLNFGDVTFHDSIEAFNVYSSDLQPSRDFFRRLREDLNGRFGLRNVVVLAKETKFEII